MRLDPRPRGDDMPRLGKLAFAIEDRGMRRFWLRALLAPVVAMEWRHFARALHDSHGAPPPGARLLSKPLHGYLSRGLSPRARYDILVGHYRGFERRFGAARLSQILSGGLIELARLKGRRGSSFRLALGSSTTSALHTQREGELVLTLFRDGGIPLSRLTFALLDENANLTLAIGGQQGPATGEKAQVIEATRELHGLRPKDATLLAARALSAQLGRGPVYAVSDARHVCRSDSRPLKLASYDSYWRERGAQEGGPFGFVLPALLPAKPGRTGRDRAKREILAAVHTFCDAP